jgi:hypothetical protein
MANTVVALDKKVAAPLPPNTAPVIPEPPKAPAKPSPLADCIKTTIIKAMQINTCSIVKNTIKVPPTVWFIVLRLRSSTKSNRQQITI